MRLSALSAYFLVCSRQDRPANAIQSFPLGEELEICQIGGDKSTQEAVLILPSALTTHIVLTKRDLGAGWAYATSNVAFQIEDELATGIEDNIIGWTSGEERVDIYVAERAIIEHAINTLSEHKIATRNAVAELNVLNLTLAEDCLTKFNDTTIVRDGDGRAFASTCKTEQLAAIAPSKSDEIKQNSIQFCTDVLGSRNFGTRLASLLPDNVRRANVYKERLDLCRPVFWSCALTLSLVIFYFLLSTALLSRQAERVNEAARAIHGEKYGSSQSFDSMERLAKLQIERGDPIQKMEFDKLLAEMALPLRTLNRDSASITNVFFDETKGISIRLKFASLEQYEQYAGALKQQIAFDTKEVATTADGTYATFTTFGNLD